VYSLFRPFLFRLDPETAHHLTLQLVRLAGVLPPAGWVLQAMFSAPQKPLEVFGLKFKNPVGLAAGYDKDGVAIQGLARLGFGHLEIGTVTLRPQPGNPRPRVFRLVEDQAVAAYFEGVLSAAPGLAPKNVANWITGDLFSLMNQNGITIGELRISPPGLAELLEMTAQGQINAATAKAVLGEMAASGEPPGKIIARRGFGQISDSSQIATLVAQVLEQNSKEVASYLAGKETVVQWFFGQVMRRAQGQANPQVVQAELERQLEALKTGQQD